jgi:hypothetical protein
MALTINKIADVILNLPEEVFDLNYHDDFINAIKQAVTERFKIEISNDDAEAALKVLDDAGYFDDCESLGFGQDYCDKTIDLFAGVAA